MKKKFLFTLILVSVVVTGSFAKGSNAIGVRLGGDNEISYQRDLGKTGRLEADFGFGWGNQINLTGVYQWMFDLSSLSKGFEWYAGVGGNVGLWNTNFGLSVVGQIGIEYNFSFPLQLSLDYRPGIRLINHDYGWGSYTGFALGARYCF